MIIYTKFKQFLESANDKTYMTELGEQWYSSKLDPKVKKENPICYSTYYIDWYGSNDPNSNYISLIVPIELVEGTWGNIYNVEKIEDTIQFIKDLKSDFFKRIEMTGDVANISKYLFLEYIESLEDKYNDRYDRDNKNQLEFDNEQLNMLIGNTEDYIESNLTEYYDIPNIVKKSIQNLDDYISNNKTEDWLKSLINKIMNSYNSNNEENTYEIGNDFLIYLKDDNDELEDFINEIEEYIIEPLKDLFKNEIPKSRIGEFQFTLNDGNHRYRICEGLNEDVYCVNIKTSDYNQYKNELSKYLIKNKNGK